VLNGIINHLLENLFSPLQVSISQSAKMHSLYVFIPQRFLIDVFLYVFPQLTNNLAYQSVFASLM
jgi:hypothetical protein